MARTRKVTTTTAPCVETRIDLVLPPLGKPLAGPGEPLKIVAHLMGPIALPWGPLALDSLLAWATCARRGMAAPADSIRRIEIPVAREPGGRFHLASFSRGDPECHEATWVNRRFPVPEAQALAEARFKRIQINAGAQKNYRIPLVLTHFRGDLLTWYALGDRQRISDLLSSVGQLGKRRGVGHGELRRWTVDPCEPWPGFPVLLDGRPLRPLPDDWPGLIGGDLQYRRLSYPYWLAGDEVLCAVPVGW